MSQRTNQEWTPLIQKKISEVFADYSNVNAPLSSITSPEDPSFALTIDHTLLKPDATKAQVDALCDEALKYGFKSCCVNGVYAKQVANRLEGSKSIACCVVGFPLGAGQFQAKAFEAQQAIADGAREIDTVIPIGILKSKDYAHVFADIRATVEATAPHPVKVIIETVFLTDEEKIAASYVAAEAGAAFVKTCTGFSGGAASTHDVSLMAKTVAYRGGSVRVKASGGVRSFEACLEMFKAGAERIGSSSGAAIMENATGSAGY
ncbi:hypothetical protein BDQ12DRAFT_685377 [Crucibulum laeve]|uniref:deoxyribose-phosphate aldolase n=1 Tax=Crucibulum laeve TaxID=68775 RepID=A0A5C3M028_9AGAR|nr:hypothetical protein BDQ12DRAFT_685377 [Crucibulum laeve]